MTQVENGFSTTFWSDFSIADRFGIPAIKDTYNRAFDEWKTDYRYLTDLVMVLNHKCWEHHHVGHARVSELYADLFYKAQDYAYENLQGDELRYFIEVTD